METHVPAYTETDTHRHEPIFFVEQNGRRFGYVAIVSKTRNCSNCAHDGSRDPNWFADGGVEEFGRCMELCSAAEAPDPAHHWCDGHQTPREFESNVHCPATPVLSLV